LIFQLSSSLRFFEIFWDFLKFFKALIWDFLRFFEIFWDFLRFFEIFNLPFCYF
jgi:hypothetical protein